VKLLPATAWPSAISFFGVASSAAISRSNGAPWMIWL
jgi:hypothetical protein